MFREVRELHHVEEFQGAGLALGLVPALQLQGEFHVASHRSPVEERRLLERHPVELLFPSLVGGVTGDAHVAFGCIGEVGNDAQQGGLATAGGPDERNELSGLDGQVHVLQRRYLIGLTLVEDLPDAVGVDCVLGCRRAHALFSLGRLRVR